MSKLHPSDVIATVIQNTTKKDRLEDLVVTRRDRVTRKGHTYEAVFFLSGTFPGETGLFACERFVRVIEEGLPQDFFENEAPPPQDDSVPPPLSIPRGGRLGGRLMASSSLRIGQPRTF